MRTKFPTPTSPTATPSKVVVGKRSYVTMWETIVLFLEQNAVAAGSAGGIAGVGVVIRAVVKAPSLAPNQLKLHKPASTRSKAPKSKKPSL